jgi:thiamine pyrophosphate-dependent acetolactate synthase large subunit-like protein
LTVRVGSLFQRGLEGDGGLVAERGVEAVGVVDVRDEGADAAARVATSLGAKGRALLDRELNGTRLVEGMGVEASRATTVEEFVAQFRSATNGRGPRLIDAAI